MPRTNSANKAVRSFRISPEGANQLKTMAKVMGRSESNVIEVALDRMYREEIRYSQVLRETADADSQYRVDRINGEKNENVRLDLEDPLETISKRHHA